MKRDTAPGGKITLADYERLLLEDACYMERKVEYLSDRQVARIIKGESWASGWMPSRTGEQYKNCRLCGKRYERRYPNGRLRSPKFWAQKETCSNSCAVKLTWQRTTVRNRRA